MHLTNKTQVILYSLIGSFFLLGFFLRLECLEVVRLNEWLTRDIDRAFNLFDGTYFPLAGPETTNGFRLPGPFLYILMATPLWFHYSYDAIFNFNFILNFSSLLISFFVIKKYFDLKTAFIVTGFQSTHLLYLEAIAFPINPAFLLPVIPILFYYILEFSLKGNQKVLPLIAIIISLGIQIHLSLATYLLVPIISAILFKIKISLRVLIKTIALTLLCFLPFIFYVNNSYTPELSLKSVTKFDPFSSIIEPIKILAVQNTINNLGNYHAAGNMSNFIGISKLLTIAQIILLNISLIGLFLFIIYKIKEEGIQKTKSEIIVFLLFYCSAFIYDLIRPWFNHFWYNYIFILPMALLISKFFTTAIEVLKPNPLKLLTTMIGFSLLAYFTFYNITYFYKTKNVIKETIYIGDYQSFKGLSLFSLEWSKTLGVSINFFFRNIYIQGMDLFSTKLPKLLSAGQLLNEDITFEDNNFNCLYIVDERYNMDHFKDEFKKERIKHNAFLTDPTVEILLTRKIILKGNNLPKLIWNSRLYRKYLVYEYRSIYDQPCYVSQINPFPSSPEDKTLLDDYFSFQKTGNNLLEKKVQLDSSGILNTLKVKYILSGEKATHPVRLQINLKKNLSNYDLSIKVGSYSWGVDESDNFIFKNLDLHILNGNKPPITRPVISKDSWISNGYGMIADKFNWYRNFKLGNVFIPPKEKLYFKISGKLFFGKTQKEKDFYTLIPITLKN